MLCQYDVGEVVTSMTRVSLVAGDAESLIYVTVTGRVGALMPFTSRELPFAIPVSCSAVVWTGWCELTICTAIEPSRHSRHQRLSSFYLWPSIPVVTAGTTADPFHIYVWNLQTGRLLDALTGHAGPLCDLAFFPANGLPRAKRGDDGSTEGCVEVLTSQVAFSSTGREWAAVSGEGLHVYSLDNDMIFDPISLTEAITPAAVETRLS